ncbi:hypothetical protein F383_24418 [Gossypium arboreum]|uniref:Uncharacterized protein n=1 Tax=Gossypium arboreum TaxID=29729 RepID=A0A0B0P9Q6_GOSAR|nr:hypothetical protein F383_24418 [Gossypium arboreum]
MMNMILLLYKVIDDGQYSFSSINRR